MTRAFRAGVWALSCWIGAAGAPRAEPLARHATVLWTRAERVYLASSDSVPPEPGTLLSFEYRGRRVAAGEVTGVTNGELIVARVTSGSLERIKKLDRIRVTAERRPLRAPPVWRVGFPSRSRYNLLYSCDSMALRPAGLGGLYRLVERTGGTDRLASDPGRSADAPWPDTLLIRRFDEAADEEIALERGELDVAVFWPGEASAHIRDAMRWKGETLGARDGGVLAAVAMDPGTLSGAAGSGPPDRGPFDSLNDGLFRGDLRPCGIPAPGPLAGPPSAGTTRFEVDRSLPGRQVLEQFLNGRARSAAPGGGAIRMFCLDASADEPESLCLSAADYIRRGAFPPAFRARAETLASEIRRRRAGSESLAPEQYRRCLGDSLRVTCLFTITCPVLSKPDLRPYLKAMGPDAFVNLVDCVTVNREP